MTEPDKFIIVPYRDRQQHLEIFLNQMDIVFKDENYQILIIHQHDTRLFNRGAMKNIGFKYVKENYPNSYKDKILIFNDVDNVPWKKGLLDFNTKKGIIKHHYGFPVKKAATLGGIFTIIASDFEKTNGFPNYWTWGMEDNAIYWRVLQNKLTIDYSNYFLVGDPNIIVFYHGNKRTINEAKSWDEFIIDKEKHIGYGINNITNLEYKVTKYQERNNVSLVNIHNFNVPEKYPKEINHKTPNGHFRDSSKNEKNEKNYGILKGLF